MKKKDEEWALFWCTLLHPALFGEVSPEETQGFLKKLASEDHIFPDGTRRKPSVSTLRRKLRTYQKEGFEALARRRRSDRGKSRTRSQETIARAVELKRDQPRRSHVTLNKFLQAEGKGRIPKSTLYRHLKEAGATRWKLGVVKEPVRCRWTYEHTHDLWVGDFEEGPYALSHEDVVPTHLSAFIDCHSRDVVEARYYFRQNLDILIDSLLRAWATHGASSKLYLDQAKIYTSRPLRAACYALNIELLHRKAGDPAGGGLIEKFFQTAQSQFEAEVRAGPILTLEELNRAFSAWLEMTYRREPSTETGEAPRERYEKGLTVLRQVDMEKALAYFMRRLQRTVHRDFSDVQLDARFYRVEKGLRGDRVEVRYDPFSSPDTVLLYSLAGEYLGKGHLHQREKGEPADAPPPQKPKYNYLDLLVRQHDEELRAKAQGIDYRRALSERAWPFHAFVKTLAQLLGRKGGPSAFSAGELEALKKIFNRHSGLTEPQLLEAFERAPEKTFPHIAYELQQLEARKEP
ncbi:MAG: DDE-type integrase/transposase/recombinase [Planctomycetes bacterium]|nr:DDE-type integrase/transposase/recombinase [Planctomycetota bacterium]